MLLYYIRHAEPIYNPDAITEYGKKQAEALASRLVEEKIDKIFCSSHNRAIETATPAAKKLGLELKALDWAREDKLIDYFGATRQGSWRWCFMYPDIIEKFCDPSVLALGDKWYDHEFFKEDKYKEGILRIDNEVDKFFESLGYKHDRSKRCFIPVKPNEEKIALVAHGGFGMVFLSSVLDIPYNVFTSCFHEMKLTGVTIIEFNERYGILKPRIVVYSDRSHLYKEGLN